MFSFFIIASRRDASFVEGYVHPNPHPKDASSVEIEAKTIRIRRMLDLFLSSPVGDEDGVGIRSLQN